MPAEVQNIGNILHDNRKWTQKSNVFDKAQIETGTIIVLVCFGVLCNFTKLRAPNPRKRQAGGNKNVAGIFNAAEIEFTTQRLRVFRNVARACVELKKLRIDFTMEIASMRLGGERVALNSADDLEASRMESERQPAAPGKEINDFEGVRAV